MKRIGWMLVVLMFCMDVRGQEVYTDLDTARIDAIAVMLPAEPAGFGKPAADRSDWDDPKFRASFDVPAIVSGAAKLLDRQLPAWDDNLYLDFSRTGRRPPGEAMLNHRSEWLFPLVMAECLENRGRFLPKVNATLEAYCQERTWTLPAHDVKLDCFYGRKYLVELRSAAFAAELAQTLYLLGDKIDPAVREHVRSAMERRIFAPMREAFATGQGEWWLQGTNNWNAVCLAGVTSAALAMIPQRSGRAVFAAAAEHYSRNFISGFPSDGYCVEGCGYWAYGFGNFIQLRERLVQATDGKLDLFNAPSIRDIALYGLRIRMNDGLAPPFGDCRVGTKPNESLVAYCNRALGLGLTGIDQPVHLRGGYITQVCMVAFPMYPPAGKSTPWDQSDDTLRTYFDQSRVLICRPGGYAANRLYIAIKAGGNGSHSHNDVGSFVVGLGKEQPLGDPGGPNAYTAETFGPLRYVKFKLLNSFGHPVPVVAGQLQVDATKVHAAVLSKKFGADEDEITIDMKPAYSVAALKSLTRTMRYNRTGSGAITIEDHFEFTSPQQMETALPTHGKWLQLKPDVLRFTLGDEALEATVKTPDGFHVTSETVEENSLPFERVGIVLNKPREIGTISVVLRPAEK
jgi:hypothetical protein